MKDERSARGGEFIRVPYPYIDEVFFGRTAAAHNFTGHALKTLPERPERGQHFSAAYRPVADCDQRLSAFLVALPLILQVQRPLTGGGEVDRRRKLQQPARQSG